MIQKKRGHFKKKWSNGKLQNCSSTKKTERKGPIPFYRAMFSDEKQFFASHKLYTCDEIKLKCLPDDDVFIDPGSLNTLKRKLMSLQDKRQFNAVANLCQVIGNMHYDVSSFTRALEFFDMQLKAINYRKGDTSKAYRNLAICHENLEQYDMALNKYLSEANNSERPDKGELPLCIARQQIRLLQLEEVPRILDNQIKIYSENQDFNLIYHWNVEKARYFLVIGDYEKANHYADGALTYTKLPGIKPDFAELYSIIGMINLKQGRFKEANTCFEHQMQTARAYHRNSLAIVAIVNYCEMVMNHDKKLATSLLQCAFNQASVKNLQKTRYRAASLLFSIFTSNLDSDSSQFWCKHAMGFSLDGVKALEPLAWTEPAPQGPHATIGLNTFHRTKSTISSFEERLSFCRQYNSFVYATPKSDVAKDMLDFVEKKHCSEFNDIIKGKNERDRTCKTPILCVHHEADRMMTWLVKGNDVQFCSQKISRQDLFDNIEKCDKEIVEFRLAGKCAFHTDFLHLEEMCNLAFGTFIECIPDTVCIVPYGDCAFIPWEYLSMFCPTNPNLRMFPSLQMISARWRKTPKITHNLMYVEQLPSNEETCDFDDERCIVSKAEFLHHLTKPGIVVAPPETCKSMSELNINNESVTADDLFIGEQSLAASIVILKLPTADFAKSLACGNHLKWMPSVLLALGVDTVICTRNRGVSKSQSATADSFVENLKKWDDDFSQS